ncbi:MAG: hypothetical protein HY908_18035 [Myxococcales bacterium]|nr:hypothetical protein [Myxococcales bacterium]
MQHASGRCRVAAPTVTNGTASVALRKKVGKQREIIEVREVRPADCDDQWSALDHALE